ncbi:response regulator transcription factor [soil metagenome]
MGRGGAGRLVYPPGMTTIVLAEDSFLIREGLGLMIENLEDHELVAVCEDAEALLELVEKYSPDVVITDIRMPPTYTTEGIQAAKRIRETHAGTGVVVLSQYVEPSYALSLFEDGSEGLAYLLKERVADLDQLTNAITEVVNGGSVIDPKVVNSMVEARLNRSDSLLDRLTPRETEVLSEIAQGKSNAAVADALYLSERAVEKHINSIFTKLDLAPERDTNRRVRAVLLYLGGKA